MDTPTAAASAAPTAQRRQQIVDRWDSTRVLFECDVPDGVESGLALRHALERAVASGANLRGANLRGAYLGALDNVPAADQITRLDAVREIILDDAKRLDMGHWHGNDEWRDRTCAEEATCGTTHCLAGWLQVCATEPEMRDRDAAYAGWLLAPVAVPLFYESSGALQWLRDREYVGQLNDIAPSASEAA